MESNVTRAVVRSVNGNEAVIEVEASGCGRCDEPGGCGGGRAKLCSGRTYRVLNPVGAVAGDRVSVAIADGIIGVTATRAYVVPLLFLFLGALLGRNLADPSLGEITVIGGAVIGLLAGWVWLKLIQPSTKSVARPAIIARG